MRAAVARVDRGKTAANEGAPEIGIVPERNEGALHLLPVVGHEVILTRPQTSGMPQASASNTRIVGMPGSRST